MTMHKIVLLLVCLARFGQARQESAPIQQSQTARVTEMRSDTEAKGELVKLILAFNPTGPIIQSTHHPGRHLMKSMKDHVLETYHITAAKCSDMAALNVGRVGHGPTMVEKRSDYLEVCIVGSLLALISGMVNVISFLQVGFPITHHTGTASHFGRLLINDERFGALRQEAALKLGAIMGSYSVGAAAAGFGKADGDAVFRGRFSILLLASAIAMGRGVFVGYSSTFHALMLWSFSQGLMNAVTTCFPDGPIRTTHVTGSLTDLGLGVGRWFRAVDDGVPRESRPSLRKPVFLALQVLSFALGGSLARPLNAAYGVEAALIPALVLAILSFGRPVRWHLPEGGWLSAPVKRESKKEDGRKKWEDFVKQKAGATLPEETEKWREFLKQEAEAGRETTWQPTSNGMSVEDQEAAIKRWNEFMDAKRSK